MKHKEDVSIKDSKGLNENHKRVISTVLGLLEKDLTLIEMHMKYEPCGRMYKIVNELTLQEKEDVLSSIKLLKESISEFANKFGLQPTEENMHGIIRGNSAINWANMCDIEPKRLNSYGKVGLDIYTELNQQIEKIKKYLNVL